MSTLLEKTSNKLVKAFLKNKIIAPIPSKFTKKLHVFDFSSRSFETKLTTFDDYLKGEITSIKLIDKYLYLSTGNGIVGINVKKSRNPRKSFRSSIEKFEYNNLKDFLNKVDNKTSAVIMEPVIFEKPNLKYAKQMLAAGNYLWNAGIFLFNAQNMIDAFSDFAAETLSLVSQSLQDASEDLGFLLTL